MRLAVAAVALVAVAAGAGAGAGGGAVARDGGGTIAFVRAHGERAEIYAVRHDGTGLRRVTVSRLPGTLQLAPAWSHDATRIAFSVMNRRYWQLFAVDRSGAGIRRITSSQDLLAEDPTWSPDGKWIAFARLPRQAKPGSCSPQQVYVVKPNGRGLRRITSFRAGAAAPAWSPDGRRILVGAWASSADDARSDVYVLNPNGRGVRRVVSNAGEPAWSPDGTRIAFVRGSGMRSEIYAANADGSGLRRLTRNAVFDEHPTWSPDGRRIAFSSVRSGAQDVYLIGAEGKGLVRLTQSAGGGSYSPDWTRTTS